MAYTHSGEIAEQILMIILQLGVRNTKYSSTTKILWKSFKIVAENIFLTAILLVNFACLSFNKKSFYKCSQCFIKQVIKNAEFLIIKKAFLLVILHPQKSHFLVFQLFANYLYCIVLLGNRPEKDCKSTKCILNVSYQVCFCCLVFRYKVFFLPGSSFINLFVEYSQSDLPPLRPLCGEAPRVGIRTRDRRNQWQGH